MEIRIVASEGAPTVHEAVDDCLSDLADTATKMLVAHNKGRKKDLNELRSKARLELMRLDLLCENNDRARTGEA